MSKFNKELLKDYASMVLVVVGMGLMYYIGVILIAVGKFVVGLVS